MQKVNAKETKHIFFMKIICGHACIGLYVQRCSGSTVDITLYNVLAKFSLCTTYILTFFEMFQQAFLHIVLF